MAGDYKRDKSGGTLFKNDKGGPVMKGSFELLPEDLKELVDLVKAGKKAEFRIAMWEKKTSAAGNDYWGLSIDNWKPDPAKAKKPSFFDDDDGEPVPF
jgi:hypothetical protein